MKEHLYTFFLWRCFWLQESTIKVFHHFRAFASLSLLQQHFRAGSQHRRRRAAGGRFRVFQECFHLQVGPHRVLQQNLPDPIPWCTCLTGFPMRRLHRSFGCLWCLLSFSRFWVVWPKMKACWAFIRPFAVGQRILLQEGFLNIVKTIK